MHLSTPEPQPPWPGEGILCLLPHFVMWVEGGGTVVRWRPAAPACGSVVWWLLWARRPSTVQLFSTTQGKGKAVPGATRDKR